MLRVADLSKAAFAGLGKSPQQWLQLGPVHRRQYRSVLETVGGGASIAKAGVRLTLISPLHLNTLDDHHLGEIGAWKHHVEGLCADVE